MKEITPQDGNMYPVMCSSVVGGKEGHASVLKLSYVGIVLLRKMKNPEMQHKPQVSSSGSLEVRSSCLQALMELSSFQDLHGNWTTKGVESTYLKGKRFGFPGDGMAAMQDMYLS